MDYVKTADWKHEKHVPVIHVPDSVKANEPFDVTVVVGEEIPHPNTADHYIAWIELYFVPEGGNTLYPLGRVEFAAHGEVQTLTEPRATFRVVIPGSGKLVAFSLCNIHGLWRVEKELNVE
jgi:superoxide reductase